jgi:hypothetical protein
MKMRNFNPLARFTPSAGFKKQTPDEIRIPSGVCFFALQAGSSFWQREYKAAAFSGFALHPDFPTVFLNEFLAKY